VATCKFCKKEITWLKEGRKNVPVESDGTVHKCEEFEKSLKSIRQLDKGSLSPEEIAKYEQGINKKK
jgi:MoaA/NifB/PqqE/SkfB family radical SAM enzyme